MSRTFVKMNIIPGLFAKDLLGLQYVTRLDVVHKRQASLLAETDKFVKTYIPGMRFNNPQFQFNRFLEESVDLPTIRVYNMENKLVETLETSNLDHEQIRQRLVLIDAKLAEQIEKQRAAN